MKQLVVFLLICVSTLAHGHGIFKEFVIEPEEIDFEYVIYEDIVYKKLGNGKLESAGVLSDNFVSYLLRAAQNGYKETYKDEEGWVYAIDIPGSIKTDDGEFSVSSIGYRSIGMYFYEDTINGYDLNIHSTILRLPPTIERIERGGFSALFYVENLTVNSLFPPFAYNEGVGKQNPLVTASECFEEETWCEIFKITIPEGALKYYSSAPGWRNYSYNPASSQGETLIEDPSLENGVLADSIFDCNGWVARYIGGTDNEVELYFKVMTDNEPDELDIPAELTHDGKTYTVTRLGREIFTDTHYSKINLPTTIRAIGRAAFAGSNVIEVTGLDNVEKLDKGALSSPEMHSLILPEKISVLTKDALYYGRYHSQSGTPIWPDNPYGPSCYLDYLEMPATLEAIEDLAVYNVILNNVVCRSTTPPAANDKAFYFCAFGKLFVPDESVELYRNAPGWRQFEVVGINQAGIDNIEGPDAEAAPVEYYNMQGIRVSEPVKGALYIERTGSKSRKIIF